MMRVVVAPDERNRLRPSEVTLLSGPHSDSWPYIRALNLAWVAMTERHKRALHNRFTIVNGTSGNMFEYLDRLAEADQVVESTLERCIGYNALFGQLTYVRGEATTLEGRKAELTYEGVMFGLGFLCSNDAATPTGETYDLDALIAGIQYVYPPSAPVAPAEG